MATTQPPVTPPAADPWWASPLGSVVAGRPVILAGGTPWAWTEHLSALAAARAGKVLILATEGAGVRPGSPDGVASVVVWDPPAGLLMDRVRASNEFLRRPSPEVIAALDEFDPHHEALVLGTFLSESATLAGRPFLSYRRPEWVAYEDKTTVDALWDRCGVTRLPSEVVPVADAAAAARALDRGTGTVWALDARSGWHGGASGVRWVTDDAEAAATTTELSALGDAVRVMPFAEGIACSIHGIVLPDGVAVLRPVEMVTLRRGHEFLYAGCATFWDPPAAVREEMRAVARRVGAALRDEIGFRGTFTVDGVATEDGFRPTELNPRFGAGINTIARAGADVPILLVHDLVVGGVDLGIGAADLEAALVGPADAQRGGGTWQMAEPNEVFTDRGLDWVDGEWAWSTDTGTVADADATLSAGRSSVRCLLSPTATPVGPSVGARAVALYRFCDAHLGTSFGPLTAARAA